MPEDRTDVREGHDEGAEPPLSPPSPLSPSPPSPPSPPSDDRARGSDAPLGAPDPGVWDVRSLEAVFEAMTDAVFICDRDGIVRRSNAAFRRVMALDGHRDYASYALLERGETIVMRDEQGRPLPPDHWPVTRIIGGEVLTSAHPVDVLIRAFDGRDVLLSVTGAPLYDAAGHVDGGVWYLPGGDGAAAA